MDRDLPLLIQAQKACAQLIMGQLMFIMNQVRTYH